MLCILCRNSFFFLKEDEHLICVHDHLDSETFTENINQYVNN